MATVTLATCTNVVEAEILKGALESAGVPCILQGENSSLVNAIPAVDVQILVREEDLEVAKEAIEKSQSKA